MSEMKTLTINGKKYTVTDPDAAMIDDPAVGQNAWSSKNIIDRLCPAFSESGAVVSCEPVEGCPLTVTTQPDATKIIRCGKNLYNHEGAEIFLSATGTYFSVTKTPTGYSVNGATTNGYFALVPVCGLAELSASGSRVALSEKIAGTPATFNLVICSPNFSDRTSIYEYNGSFNIPKASEYPDGYIVAVRLGGDASNSSEAVVTYDNIQLEMGATDTAYEPFTGFDTFTPGEQIPALPGRNILYADSGEITVTGRADPTAIINNLQNRLAAVEAAVVNNT